MGNIVKFQAPSLVKGEQEGYWRIVLRWKKDKKTGKPGRQTLVGLVPAIPIPSSLVLKDAIEEKYRQIISDRVRELVGASRDVSVNVDAEMLDVVSLAQWYAVKLASQRLTKDAINAWFNVLVEIALEQAGDKDISRVLAHFRDGFLQLASPHPKLSQNNVEQMLIALERYFQDDRLAEHSLSEKISDRLVLLARPQEEEVLDASAL